MSEQVAMGGRMKYMDKLIDKAIEKVAPPTEHRLARQLGCHQNTLRNARKRGSAGWRLVKKLCVISGDDLTKTMLDIQMERVSATVV
jgi:hypothetical protein